jgi:hypothetical protein
MLDDRRALDPRHPNCKGCLGTLRKPCLGTGHGLRKGCPSPVRNCSPRIRTQAPLYAACATYLVKYPQWPGKESPVVLYTKCRRIYGEPLLPTQRRELHGRTLRRSRATNGSAGLFPSRNLKPESSTSRERARSLKKECVGPAAGPVALIVEISGLSATLPQSSRIRLDTNMVIDR